MHLFYIVKQKENLEEEEKVQKITPPALTNSLAGQKMILDMFNETTRIVPSIFFFFFSGL